MITFSVTHQILTRTDTDRVIADSQNHVKAMFTLDEEWQGLTVTAVFQNGNTTRALYNVAADTAVTVPWEVLHPGNMHVYLEGYDGELRLTTARLDRPVRVYPSGRVPWSFTRNEPSPSLYEQLVAACRELKTLILGKVTAVTDASRVYATDSDGQPTALPYSAAAGASHVVLSTAAGTLASAEPVAGSDAATKNYVDAAVPPRSAADAGKVLAVNNAGVPCWDGPKVAMVSGSQYDNVVYGRLQGTETALNFATSSATANTIVRRDGSGRIKTNTPSINTDAANKSYVDNKISALDTLTVSAVSDASHPNTTMRFTDGIQISYGSVGLSVANAADLLTLSNGKHLYQLTLSLSTGNTALFAENFYSVGFCRLSYQDDSDSTALSLTGSAGTGTFSNLSGVFLRSSGTAALPGKLYYTVIGRWKA